MTALQTAWRQLQLMLKDATCEANGKESSRPRSAESGKANGLKQGLEEAMRCLQAHFKDYELNTREEKKTK